MLKFFFSTILFVSISSAVHAQPAFSYTASIFAMDEKAAISTLPNKLCVEETNEFRLRPDVLNGFGQPLNVPANQFVWRLTLGNGQWVQWDARISNEYGPFKRGLELNSVYVKIPNFKGQPVAALDLFIQGAYPVRFLLQDVKSATPTIECEYAPATSYVIPKP